MFENHSKSLKTGQTPQNCKKKWHPTSFFDFRKMSHTITCKRFFGGRPKYGLPAMHKWWPNFFFGKFWEFQAKMIRTPKNVSAPAPMVAGV